MPDDQVCCSGVGYCNLTRPLLGLMLRISIVLGQDAFPSIDCGGAILLPCLDLGDIVVLHIHNRSPLVLILVEPY